LDIRRNITIIRGDSATGKTTLITLLNQAATLGESSGVEVICKKPCRTLSGNDWELLLPNLHEQIIFLDEENRFIKTQEFAEAVKASDNYFVLVTREDLPNLPYSVEEIYGIHAAGKYHDLKRTYNEMYRIYGAEEWSGAPAIKPEVMIVEDSHSGYQFFKQVCAESKIACSSAGGKSNLKNAVTDLSKKSLLIADGAAIGSEMNELYQMMRRAPNVKCYLPESFEWLILKSGLVKEAELPNLLEQPEQYIESREYFSWEQFFTAKLIEHTKNTYLKYQKSKLNPVYLHEKSVKAILAVMKGIEL
jgi:hypothetical protein